MRCFCGYRRALRGLIGRVNSRFLSAYMDGVWWSMMFCEGVMGIVSGLPPATRRGLNTGERRIELWRTRGGLFVGRC